MNVNATAIPMAIRERPQWVAWRREQRGGKTTKVPYDPKTGRRASVADSKTWATFEQAVAAGKVFDGIGYVLTANDPFVGIDLDHAIRDEGTIEPWADDIVRTLSSYTERSPSGRGIHVFVRGVLPPGARRRGNVEMYDSGRFLTITAARVDGSPEVIEDRTVAVAAIHAKYVARDRGHSGVVGHDSIRGDSEVLSLLFGERDGGKWRALSEGRWADFYPSQSEADVALARKLRFYSSGDREQVRRLLLASGLRRAKWDEARGSTTFFEGYVIDAAFRPGGKVYVPPRSDAEPMTDGFALVPHWVRERSSAADLRVYAALASFANRERACWPSIATLATVARISARRVQIALRRLEAARSVFTQRRSNASNVYVLPLHQPKQRGDGIDTALPYREEQRGDVFSTPLIEHDEQRGDEIDTALHGVEGKGVTFSHQWGDDNCSPEQYQEDIWAQGEGVAETHTHAREVLADGRPRVLYPDEMAEADLIPYALAKTNPARGVRCGSCSRCGSSACWFDRLANIVGCIECDQLPEGSR